MKKKFLSLILVLTASFSNAQVEYVDPTIGGVGVLEPTRPTVHLPNSMIRVYPIRNDQLDDQIKSFPLTMVTHRLGVFFGIMPGEDKPAAWDQEITTPYYYSTRFDDSLIQTEFSPAEQSGYYRFHFPKKNAEIHLKTVRNGELKQIDEKTVSGFEELKPTPSIEPMRAYFYGELSESFKGSVQENGGMKHLTLKSKGEVIGFRYGISYISIDQAKKNLHREIPEWNFELVKNNAKARWNKTLSQIEIKGGTESQKRVFYTALYRTYERMVNITEGGRYYSAYDRQVHEDSRPFYVDNWLWDSYHAQGPLNVLLNPEMTADQIQSYIRMYEQSGWVPSFALLWGDWPAMNGNHAAAWFSDAWFKGIRNFDMKKGLEGVRKNSLEATLLPWANGPKTALDEFYNQNGFFPGIREDEKETEPRVVPNEYRQSVSVTLANSYDDWCIAQISRSLGDRSGYDQFMKRSQFYKNVWNSKEGFMWPKDANGKWIEKVDPKNGGVRGGRYYWAENNAYTYNWDVNHDFDSLFSLMGGVKAAEAKLDQLFREPNSMPKYMYYALYPDSSGQVGQFVMGNEPSFSIPYLYNQLGSPWKTQKRVRSLLEQWFTNDLRGIPGDEDGGGMSAWVVFSMIGIYPTTAGLPVYDFGSPTFDEVTINLHHGKKIVIETRNNSRNNKYIQKVRFNGKEWNQSWFRHAEIANGARIEIEMGDTPNRSWATSAESLLPRSAKLNPESLMATP